MKEGILILESLYESMKRNTGLEEREIDRFIKQFVKERKAKRYFKILSEYEAVKMSKQKKNIKQ